MEDSLAKEHHLEAIKKRSKESFQSFKGRKHTPESIKKQIDTRKKHYAEDSSFRERCNKGAINKRKPIYEIDAEGNILNEFESLTAALLYKHHFRLTDVGFLTKAADKFNKNGTRKRYLNSYWSMKNKV